MLLVVDASVAFKWVVREPLQNDARKLLSPEFDLVAPELIWPELGSALWKRTRRGELDSEAAEQALADIVALIVATRPMKPLLGRAFEIALQTNRSVYDCIYLSLAEQEDTQLVTADRRFFDALARSPYAPRMKWVESA